MTRILLTLAVIACTSQEPIRLLEIEAVAFDRKGNIVTSIQPEDVEVWINGYRIPTAAVESRQATSRAIALLLDDITTDSRLVPRVRDVARRIVMRMRPDDRMAVVTVAGGFMEITSDQPKLLKRVDSYNQTAGFVTPDNVGLQVLTSITALSRLMSEETNGRKSIVAIGNGGVFDTPIPPPQAGRELQREWLDAVRAMAAASVSLYVVDPGGVGSSRAGMGRDGFARDAGGHAFINTNDLNGAIDQIFREMDTYHVIRVADPPIGRGGAIRDLDVRSKRAGVTIRARRTLPGR